MNIKKLFAKNKTLITKIEQHRERLYRVAFSWCHDPMLSEDLVQETLISGMEKIDSLRDPKALTGWLFAILNNHWRQYLRKQRPFVDIDELVFESDACPVSEVVNQQKQDNIRVAMVKLPLGQRQVITMVDLEDMAYSEVSEALNIPIGTVMSRLSRARKNLLGFLQKQESLPQQPYLRRVK